MADDETKNNDASPASHASHATNNSISVTLKRMGSISYSINWDYQEQEGWVPLKDVPFRSDFVAFQGTIVAMSYGTEAVRGYWGDGIYVYNVESDIWDKYASYPNNFDSTNLSIALNKHTNELYGFEYGNTRHNYGVYVNTLKVINLKEKTFITKSVNFIATKEFANATFLNSISTVFINGKYHVFAGESEKIHLILNTQFDFNELEICCKSVQLGANYHCERPWAIMYNMNKRMIILGGDYDTWMKKVPLYVYEMHGDHVKSRWKKVLIELPNQIEETQITTRPLSYCYHEKSENILIFDGLRGKYIYVVNINDFKVKESKIMCPENKVYDVVFVSHMCENERTVMGYAREHGGYQQLPHDILHEIANWMEGFDCIHLFDKNRGLCHWVIDVDSIINNVY
eukprot:465155_1